MIMITDEILRQDSINAYPHRQLICHIVLYYKFPLLIKFIWLKAFSQLIRVWLDNPFAQLTKCHIHLSPFGFALIAANNRQKQLGKCSTNEIDFDFRFNSLNAFIWFRRKFFVKSSLNRMKSISKTTIEKQCETK